MSFHCPLPRDLQLLVLEFNSPPLLDGGLLSYLEWMRERLEEEQDALDTVTMEFCLEPVFSLDARQTPAPRDPEPLSGQWEIRLNVRMKSDPDNLPGLQFKLHWEDWEWNEYSHDVSFDWAGFDSVDFYPPDWLEFAPRQLKKMPRCRICPNQIEFDGAPEDIMDYFDFHASELMAGPVRFRNAHLLT